MDATVDERILQRLNEHRQNRRTVFADLLQLPDDWMGRVGSFQGQPISVQWMTLRYADHDEEHAVQLADTLAHHDNGQQNRVHRLLAVNEILQGELLAALEGLTDADLDVRPADPAGEWSLRETLSHIIFVEHAYRIDILDAIEHANAGTPVTELQDVDLPEIYPDDTLTDLINRIDTARDQTFRELAGMDERYLSAQTKWGDLEVDVNFLIMRFGHHVREHTAHIQKWRVQTGIHQSEMARLFGRSWVTTGYIRGNLIGTDSSTFTRQLIPGEWSAAEIIDHLQDTDSFIQQRIASAKTWAEWEATA